MLTKQHQGKKYTIPSFSAWLSSSSPVASTTAGSKGIFSVSQIFHLFNVAPQQWLLVPDCEFLASQNNSTDITTVGCPGKFISMFSKESNKISVVFAFFS